MSIIEKLYYDMPDLVDKYVDMPDVLDAREKLEKTMGNELMRKYEDGITELSAASEKQGFLYGFGLAVDLLMSGKAVG